MNDLNRLHYTIFGDPATIFTARTALGIVATRATGDQSITTNVTLASATNMSFAIGASEEWIADFDMVVGDDLTTTGVQFAVTVPSSATMLFGLSIASSAPAAVGRYTTTGGAALDYTTGLTLGNQGIVHGTAWVLNSTNAGTVQLQIAQSTSSGTALVLKKGSHMRAQRIA